MSDQNKTCQCGEGCKDCKCAAGCKRENWNLKEIGGWKGFLKKLYRHHKPSGGALILRIALGVLFITEGWTKLNGIVGTEHFFAMLGLSSFWVYLVAYTEFVGGILILVGLLIKPVCVALAIDMAVIVWGVPAKGGLYWGHPYEFFLLCVFLALYIMGPGKYSLAHLWLRRKGSKST